MKTELLSSITSIIEMLIAVSGFVLVLKEYYKTKRNKTKKMLAEQVIAYYSEEQEAIKWIEELSPDKIPNLQKELRKKAQNNEHNLNNIYPKLTAKQAEDYLC